MLCWSVKIDKNRATTCVISGFEGSLYTVILRNTYGLFVHDYVISNKDNPRPLRDYVISNKGNLRSLRDYVISNKDNIRLRCDYVISNKDDIRYRTKSCQKIYEHFQSCET